MYYGPLPRYRAYIYIYICSANEYQLKLLSTKNLLKEQIVPHRYKYVTITMLQQLYYITPCYDCCIFF